MRKALVCGLLMCIVWALTWATLAAQPSSPATAHTNRWAAVKARGPQAQVKGAKLQAQEGTRISSPADNAVVRGTVPIVGSAWDPDFWKYEAYFGPDPNPADQWTFIGSVHEKQVLEGLLETWYTNSVPDGTYSLRLRVVNRTGNYHEAFVRGILVANAAPTDTPTPTQTPPATATITPAATPTFIIPSSPLAQPTPTPTLARPTGSMLPGAFDVATWRQSFCLGAELMAAMLILIGVILTVRRRF